MSKKTEIWDCSWKKVCIFCVMDKLFIDIYSINDAKQLKFWESRVKRKSKRNKWGLNFIKEYYTYVVDAVDVEL